MDYQDEPVVVKNTAEGIKISLIGSIHTNTSWVEDEFKKVIDARPQRVELDLKETTYISSWAVGMLIWLHTGVTKAGGTVFIPAVQKRVYSTLCFARLDKMMKLTPEAIVDP